MDQTADFWIKKLGLEKHPEGGWYKEIYRSADMVMTAFGERNTCTSIYYLPEGDDFSAFHRIRSDEIWHYYTGNSAIDILWIKNRELQRTTLGNKADKGEHFQVAVPKNRWFATRLTQPDGFVLAGCTVAPGFHFDDFELATRELLKAFPELSAELKPLIRG